MMKFATPLRNAILDAIEAHIGPSPILLLKTGAPPADGDAAASGVTVATMNLPADWMAAAASGSKALLGTWQDTSADSTNTVGHFELRNSSNANMIRGTVTVTGGGGDITLDQINLNATQSVTITAFNLVAPNA